MIQLEIDVSNVVRHSVTEVIKAILVRSPNARLNSLDQPFPSGGHRQNSKAQDSGDPRRANPKSAPTTVGLCWLLSAHDLQKRRFQSIRNRDLGQLIGNLWIKGFLFGNPFLKLGIGLGQLNSLQQLRIGFLGEVGHSGT